MDIKKGLEPTNIQPEIIYIDEESNSTLSLSKQSRRSKRSHEKKNYKVNVEHYNNRETLIISQKVKVNKQKIQCIINLTKVCEYEEAYQSKKHSKKVEHAPITSKKSIKKLKEPKSSSNVSLSSPVDPKKSPLAALAVPKVSLNSPASFKSKNSPKVNLSAKVERIVPNCLRSRCKSEISRKCCKKYKNKKYSERHSKNKSHEADISRGSEGYLSSISSPSLQLSPELEDISSDSFTVCSDDHLDTLIKRTRDRERRLSKKFEYKTHLRTSTSKHSDISDAETFILEPQLYPDLNLYTTLPTQSDLKQEKIFDNLKHFNNQRYEKNYPAINTQTYEGNLQMKCHGILHKYKFYDEKNSHPMDFAFPIKSNENKGTDNKYAFVKSERSDISEVRKELYTYNNPFGIKQEKSSSLCKDYSQTVTDFWTNNKDFNLQERGGKFFTYENLNKVPNIVPNVKVENRDFTSFR